jgi:hypothetical protein
LFSNDKEIGHPNSSELETGVLKEDYSKRVFPM